MNRYAIVGFGCAGYQAPLPATLRGLLAREGFTDEFLELFERRDQA